MSRTLTTAWIYSDRHGDRIVKAESTSQQLAEDPFSYGNEGGESGLQAPPYSLDALAAMLGGRPDSAPGNTLHYRAVKQKASDVAGRGFSLRSTSADEDAPSGSPAWDEFVTSVEDDQRGDESFKERIVQAHEDFESIGWGILEVSRRGDGMPDGLWHVPAHTVRAHKDGRRFAMQRAGKTVWFKRFGRDGDVDRKNGGWSTSPMPDEVRGNELIVVRNYTPISTYYGLPDHIPALAALAGWRAQAEFNVRFFDNSAIPAYAVIIEGADISPELEEKILDHFKAIKGDPHRTLIIPVPGASGDDAVQIKVRFERLSVEIKDASFRLYKQDNALEICIAHGIPPYRIGWPIVGSLGGSTAEEMTEIYNDSIIQPRQETWEQRLTRALLGAKGLNLTGFVLKAAELDTRNETRDVEKAKALYEMDALLPDEARQFFGMDALAGGRGQKTRSESAPPPDPRFGGLTAIDGGLLAKRFGPEVSTMRSLQAEVRKLLAGDAAEGAA